MAEEADMCWALVGATASGKTEVALELCRRNGLEVVSVDSMQVYRGMDIGTAKPTERERQVAEHHMIDVLEPEERCNVARFCRMAEEAVERIRARGHRPLLVGGSPMYFKGLLWGLMEAPGRDEELRRRLRRQYEQNGPEAMHRRLAEVDPEAAERIHPNDVQRLVRALEFYELTGRPISRRQDQFEGPPRKAHRMVGLRWPRPKLYERINRRVERMMEQGLLQEVKGLRDRLGPQASQAVGYKELMSYLDGEASLEEAVRLVKRNTRRLARHQMTWFRRFPVDRWIALDEPADVPAVVHTCRVVFQGAA